MPVGLPDAGDQLRAMSVRMQREVRPARFVLLKVAWRGALAAIVGVALVVAVQEWRAIADVRTRWLVEPALCENSQGTWQRCPWVKR